MILYSAERSSVFVSVLLQAKEVQKSLRNSYIPFYPGKHSSPSLPPVQLLRALPAQAERTELQEGSSSPFSRGNHNQHHAVRAASSSQSLGMCQLLLQCLWLLPEQTGPPGCQPFHRPVLGTRMRFPAQKCTCWRGCHQHPCFNYFYTT